MNDKKEYISQQDELGSFNISEEVIAVIAAVAATDVEGVSGLAANLGADIAELLGKKNLSKGVKIQLADSVVTVTISILVKYGYTIPDVAKKVQEEVGAAIEAMTGLDVSAVNVHIAGIYFDKEAK